MLLWLNLSAAKHTQNLIFRTFNLSVAAVTGCVGHSFKYKKHSCKLNKLFVGCTQIYRL